MAAGAVVTFDVLCPNFACGDPVGGRIPQPPERLKLTCLHCKQTFTFEEGDVRQGISCLTTVGLIGGKSSASRAEHTKPLPVGRCGSRGSGPNFWRSHESRSRGESTMGTQRKYAAQPRQLEWNGEDSPPRRFRTLLDPLKQQAKGFPR